MQCIEFKELSDRYLLNDLYQLSSSYSDLSYVFDNYKGHFTYETEYNFTEGFWIVLCNLNNINYPINYTALQISTLLGPLQRLGGKGSFLYNFL
jgi:hypothetical protein